MHPSLRPSLRSASKAKTLIQYRARKFGTIPVVPYSQRCYSTAPTAVDLDYTEFIPPNGNTTDGAFVILHGLFGSRRNFASLCKAFLRDLGRPVYALDLRNHGSSPHVAPMNYESMASDVRQFLDAKKLTGVSLMGHSMGGKVAMTLALSPSPPVLSNLIISDIAPTQTSLSPSFIRYLNIMSHIEDPTSDVRTREHTGKILETVEQVCMNIGVRQFLLTNLVLPSDSEPTRKTVKFQIPIPILANAIPDLGSFPYGQGPSWNGKTLVVKGLRSNYINEENIPILKAFFPNMKLKTMNTGHWVHGEKPNEFKDLVIDFIR
ncbi:alpha/beta-hydrolase [Collybia nuda]|uniref:Alpha/beta-hydrolase n=1 Tax=Collybia nuda TaxID=64659 RepID=A0A9P6CC75_9AGAR|nr:alpha/beta-hydrolase [Collybia nuda]